MGARQVTTIRIVSNWHRERAIDAVCAAPLGHIVKISEPTRSLDQSAKMWALLSDISKAKPLGRTHTPEVWKFLMMQACGHECQFEMGIDNRPFPVGFSSSKLTVRQMSELLEFMQAWAVQHGVALSDGLA